MHMRIRRLFPFLFATLLVVAAMPSTSLAKEAATDTFVAQATTGAGQAMPVEIDPTSKPVSGPNGSIGLAYIFKASGEAFGSVPGTLTYVEHGYLYFMNPLNPATYVGSEYSDATFTVTARGTARTVKVVDTNPAAYSHGTNSVALPKGGHGASDAYGAGLKKLGLLNGNNVTYGYFGFTTNYGTFTGYATPDFRNFTIRVKFDA
jgi:hypothetical protein